MLCEGDEIEVADLGLRASGVPTVSSHSSGNSPATGGLIFDFEGGTHTAEEVERTLMLQALEHTRGNVSKAARLIGMQRSSFRYRIERYSLDEQVREIVER